jgi:hypothetical protein
LYSAHLEDADGADDEREVRRDAERVVEGDLREIRRHFLEVDVLGSAPLQRLVEHARQRRQDGLEVRPLGVAVQVKFEKANFGNQVFTSCAQGLKPGALKLWVNLIQLVQPPCCIW